MSITIMRKLIITSVVTIALVFAADIAFVAPAGATFPGQNGLIALSAPVADISQIFVMNPDGSGQQQLTQGTAAATDPSISPDGKTVVFNQRTATSNKICAMTTGGANLRTLAASGEWPAFSPDGGQVVFVGKKGLWVMNADGSHRRRLTTLGRDTQALLPTYSPNGKMIVFVAHVFVSHPVPSPKDCCQILAVNASGKHLRRLAYTTMPKYMSDWPTCGVSFSPDGKKIVYSAYTKKVGAVGEVLRVMDAAGSNQRLLPGSHGCTWPCFSPDGQQILCENSHSQVCVERTNGTQRSQLTHISGGVGWAPNWGPQALSRTSAGDTQ